MLRYTHELKPGLLQLSFVRRHRQLTSTTTVCTERSRQVNPGGWSPWTHLTCSAGIALAACLTPCRLQTGNTDVPVATRLRIVISQTHTRRRLRPVAVSARLAPSHASYRGPVLVWATGRSMSPPSPDRGFGTSCLLHCQFRRQLKTFLFVKDYWTRLRHLVTLAFRRRI